MINTFNQSPQLKQSGFSLLEILITLLVITVGLLGLAHLQTSSLQSNHEAYQRSQDTLLTNDIIERMKANKGELSGYTAQGGASQQTSCHTLAGCSNSDMAKNDRYEWDKALNLDSTIDYNEAKVTLTTADIYSVIIQRRVSHTAVQWTSELDHTWFATKFQP